ADPFGVALAEFIQVQREWQGTATELLAALLPNAGDKLPNGWPRRNGVKGRLKRLTPALSSQGIAVSWDRDASTRVRRRLIRLAFRNDRDTVVRTVRPVRPGDCESPLSDDPDDLDDDFPDFSNSNDARAGQKPANLFGDAPLAGPYG